MKLIKIKHVLFSLTLILSLVLFMSACAIVDIEDEDELFIFEQFTVTGQIGETNINYEDQTIKIEVGEEVERHSLEPSIVLLEGYSISPVGPQDFNVPVTYTVTQDNSDDSWEWEVEILIKEPELVLDLSNFGEGDMGHSNNNISVEITTEGLKVDYDIPNKNNTNVHHRWSSPFDLSEATHLKYSVYGNDCGNRLQVQFLHEENGSLISSDIITVEDSIDFTGWREIIVDLETFFEDVDFEQIRRFLLFVQNNSGVNSYVIYDNIGFWKVY